MDFDILNAGTALIPVVSDGLRGIFARITGGAGAEPQNIEERVQIMEADTARLQALAQLDSVGDTYQWVNAIRGLVRPLTAFGLVSAYGITAAFFGNADPTLAGFAQMAAFYYFGERTTAYARNGR